MVSPVELYLASKSPRRRELLTQIGVRFELLDVDVPEIHQVHEPAQAYVERLASSKALAGAVIKPGCCVLGADTVVVDGRTLLEKPRDQADGIGMLTRLSARTHQVMTGVAVAKDSAVISTVVTTQVTFREILPEEALRYWATGEPKDKAGGYGIQGYAAVFVANLEGSYSNVVGLPLAETHRLLAHYAVPIWNTSDPHE